MIVLEKPEEEIRGYINFLRDTILSSEVLRRGDNLAKKGNK